MGTRPCAHRITHENQRAHAREPMGSHVRDENRMLSYEKKETTKQTLKTYSYGNLL